MTVRKIHKLVLFSVQIGKLERKSKDNTPIFIMRLVSYGFLTFGYHYFPKVIFIHCKILRLHEAKIYFRKKWFLNVSIHMNPNKY